MTAPLPPRGRPKTGVDRKTVTIRLSDAEDRALKKAGDGSRSLGLQRMLAERKSASPKA